MTRPLSSRFPDVAEGKTLTYGEALGPAMNVQTEEEARAYFEAYVAYLKRHCPTEGRAREVARVNIGYWTGYQDAATAERVQRLFGFGHPIFGGSR